MKNRVIAVTASLPADAFKAGFDEAWLHRHGMIFEDGEFVSYAEVTIEQLLALCAAELDDCRVAEKEARAAMLELTPEGRANVIAKISPEERARLPKWVRQLDVGND